MNRTACIVAGALVLTACATGFLGPSPLGCGNTGVELPDKVRAYFASPDENAMRDSLGIVQVSPTATQAVVTDPATCERVLRVFERSVSGQPHEEDIRSHGWEYSVYELGPYLALDYYVRLPPPEGAISTGMAYSLLLIYEWSGDQLEYVGGILM